MAAAYTQVTTGARLAYTFSGDVEPNAQGLLDRSKERSEGHDVLSQTYYRHIVFRIMHTYKSYVYLYMYKQL